MSILSFGGALGLGMSAISLWLSFLVAAKLKRGELVANMNFIPQKIELTSSHLHRPSLRQSLWIHPIPGIFA